MKKIALTVIIAIIAIWVGGLISFYQKIPDKNVSRETSQIYDAIIVLTGGEKRISTGVSLLKEAVSNKLFISGVYKDTRLEQVAKNVDFGSITLGDKARTTIGNVMEVQGWMSGKDIESILIVTANYHMPRAYALFKRGLPNVKISTYPVFPKDFDKQSWFNDYNSAKIIFFEYNKYLLSF